ncbi:MAG: long-chain fatty acid--CoA ligase, partial [Pseudomonadota bacterium]
SMDPLFEHSLVLGEGRPYLTLLAVLNLPLWEELAAQLGVPPAAASLNLPEVRSAILHRVEQLLIHFPGYIFVKDVGLSLQPWTVDEGLLTPTLKLKRAVIEKHMSSEIKRMY